MIEAENSEVAGYCASCNLNVGIPEASFCPQCGEKLQPPRTDSASSAEKSRTAKASVQSVKTEPTKTCMVCHETVSKGDYLDWCPFCGHPAHKMELTKWLRSNKTCPSCKSGLTEKQLQEPAAKFKGPKSKDLVMFDTIVHRGHAIGIARGKILHDGKEVSFKGKPSGQFYTLTFDTEENGKPVQYDLRMEYTSGRRSPILRSHSPIADLIYELICSSTQKERDMAKVAILRNGRFIYNEGIVIMPNSQTMRIIRGELKGKGIEPEQTIDYCPNCGAEIVIPDPSFCTCCGGNLEEKLKIATSKRGEGKTVGQVSGKCIACGTGLMENLKKGETIAWCPFCGNAAHTRCLYNASKRQRVCPSCGNSLIADDLVNQLKKRKK